MNRTEKQSIDHFLDLAHQGRVNSGCSTGERNAYRLAQALLEYGPGLDDEAINGFYLFLQYAVRNPMSAKALIEG